MKKKLLVIALAFAMTLAFAACGGGGGSEAPAGDAAAEPNTGVGSIVFAVPDGWTPAGINVGSYSSYDVPDTDCDLVVNCFGEEQLKEQNEWSEEKLDSVQAYYDKYFTLSEEDAKEKNIENSKIKICGVDADYNKYTGGKDGVYELGAYWMDDNTVYSMYMYNGSNFDEKGNVKDDATPFSDNQIKQFEAIAASVQKGDGTAFQKEALAAIGNSFGSFTYEIPEGYTVSEYSGNFINLEKDGSSITLNLNSTTADDLQYYTMADGSVPSSLQELYDQRLYEGAETTTIAGCEGFVSKWPDENGQYYNVDATFLGDDALYSVYMGGNAYDENGNLRDDAEALTEDDLAAFDALLASLTKK